MPALAQGRFADDEAIKRRGDIEYTNVIFRNEVLFPVTVKVDVNAPESTESTSASALRAETVKENLRILLNTGFTPETLKVYQSVLGSKTVIIASDPPKLDEQVIVTVTIPDARLAEKSSPKELAEDWVKIIRQTLIEAWEEDQPAARQARVNKAFKHGAGLIIGSLLLFGIRRFMINQFRRLQQRQQPLIAAISELPTSSPEPELLRQQSRLQQRITRNRSARGFLALGQIALWFWGIAEICALFPETRFLAELILSFPVQILIITVVLSVIARLCRELIHRSIQRKVEDATIYGDKNSRIFLRAPTVEVVFDGITNAAIWVIGIIWLLVWQKVDLAASLTGAGLFGAALGLIFQNLVRDWLNGILIIFEDQYAVGDVVDINGTVGAVENMSIRSTQLRAAGGRLSTIPHNQVNIVHNLTKDWSRVDLAIEVSNQADPTEVMSVMKQVATDMQRDPDWQTDILDPVNLIGVSNVSAIGTQISMRIKTQRMRQWDVEREFRRRLKLAFEQQGIGIGVPQQMLQVQSVPETDRAISPQVEPDRNS